MAEVRAGLRQGSVASSAQRPDTLERADSWNELSRELEDIGLSAAMVSEHQHYIKSWFTNAIGSGLLSESSETEVSSSATKIGDGGGPDGLASSVQRSRMMQSMSAVTSDTQSVSSSTSTHLFSQATLVDGSTTSENPSDGASFQKTALLRSGTTKSQDIDALLSLDDPPFPSLPPPTRRDTAASHSPTTLLKKHSVPSILLFRLFQKDTRLIQAASDGSIERVATLLSRGVNVNVTDRWGWTALSMAAYGGHETIAKLLLACGAEIETTDVDGDSPLDLATNRGHADVVIAIEEERANRVVRGMPSSPVRSSLRRQKTGGGSAKTDGDIGSGNSDMNTSAGGGGGNGDDGNEMSTDGSILEKSCLNGDDGNGDDNDYKDDHEEDKLSRTKALPSSSASTTSIETKGIGPLRRSNTGSISLSIGTGRGRGSIGPLKSLRRSNTGLLSSTSTSGVAVTSSSSSQSSIGEKGGNGSKGSSSSRSEFGPLKKRPTFRV